MRVLFILLLVLIASALTRPAPAQTPADDLPTTSTIERIERHWILAYEQGYGLPGLYIDPPAPAEDDAVGQVRAALIRMSRAARAYLRDNPDTIVPEVEALVEGGYLAQAPPVLPDGVRYVWSPKGRRFTTSTGGATDIVQSALNQLRSAELYRGRVARGSLNVGELWNIVLASPTAPPLLKGEAETRSYTVRMLNSEPMQRARLVQERLAELGEAIDLAVAAGKLAPGQDITMQDVARTGFIDRLLALPEGGEYSISRVGEPPVAVYGALRILLDETYPEREILRRIARRAVIDNPEYAPGRALLARTEPDPARALESMDQIVKEWPDVPAFRVQRLALNSQLGNLPAMNEDIAYLLTRFPAAPIVLEVDMATRTGPYAEDPRLRARLGLLIAEVRPMLLNAQLIGFQELAKAGAYQQADAIRQRLVDRHPGFEPLLPTAREAAKAMREDAKGAAGGQP
ncbi:MAG: hypothetical protein RLY93_01275 [Sumerlaeia bacterium]